MENETNFDKLLELAHARKHNNTVIVTFSDDSYKNVLINWLNGLHRLNIRNYLVISLDEQIHTFLCEQSIPSVLLKIEFNLDSLWAMRIDIFQLLCRSGIDFIHSDTDAVWLKNPIPEYFTTPGCHLVASQGTTWPVDVLDKQGFVFCCGLFYVQSCKQTLALFEEIAEDIQKTGDDQTSLNRVIQRKQLKWDTLYTESYDMHFRDQCFRCFNKTVTGYSPVNKLSVALLPQHLFQRLHMPGQDAFVKHLFTEKDSESKIDMLSRTGCLFLEHSPDSTNRSDTDLPRTSTKRIIPAITHRKKRILVYGMQSSGASLFSYFLSQNPDTLGIIDLNNHRLAPDLPDEFDIVLKAVVSTRWSLQDHIDSFHPDKTILFIRNPCHNYYSLMDKAYANKSGLLDEKFKLLDHYFEAREQFDLTLFYEDFILDYSGTIEKLNTIGCKYTEEHYRFSRTPQEIADFNINNSNWCRDNPAAEGPAGGWGMGNIHSSAIKLELCTKPITSEIISRVRTDCPVLYAYYQEYKALIPNSGIEQERLLTETQHADTA